MIFEKIKEFYDILLGIRRLIKFVGLHVKQTFLQNSEYWSTSSSNRRKNNDIPKLEILMQNIDLESYSLI